MLTRVRIDVGPTGVVILLGSIGRSPHMGLDVGPILPRVSLHMTVPTMAASASMATPTLGIHVRGDRNSYRQGKKERDKSVHGGTSR